MAIGSVFFIFVLTKLLTKTPMQPTIEK